MSLLQNNKRYTRPQPQEKSPLSAPSADILDVLHVELVNLHAELAQIEEAKERESNLRKRLSIVQQSFNSLLALEKPEESQPQQPAPVNVRKAATKKTDKPTARSIAPKAPVSDTENINLVHDDFATFPE
jgi:hypothetical protein